MVERYRFRCQPAGSARADRAPNEPMTAQPHVGKSVYLKLDLETTQWGIVAPDFEGESR
jgi:hypothetical protein